VEQLTVVEPGKLELLDVPEPALEAPDEAIVRPVTVATCDLDSRMISGEAPFPAPIALGHECVAEVVEVGDGVGSFARGDRVSVPFQISCGSCSKCLAGLTANCERVPMMSMYGFGAAGGSWGGALSDLLRVPFADHMLVSLPAGLDPAAVASVSDNVSDAWRAVGPYLEDGKGSVLVVGGEAESIGLYAAGLAVALGGEQVDYLDRDDDQLERAARLGATPIEGGFEERRGPYEITVDASGDPAGLAHALRATAPDGVCTSVAIYFEPGTTLPLLEMYTRCVTFHTGRCHARPAMPKVLELVSNGSFSPEIVTSAVIPWPDAAEGLLAVRGKRVVVRD
jgi:threonine dehydrogenase-like Zn-dependent dehydrogenase